MAGMFKNVFGSQPSGAANPDDGKTQSAQLTFNRNGNAKD
jgi:hypothetical protein